MPEIGFKGSASELLAAIEDHASDAMQKIRTWPRTAAELGGHLRRIAPVLRSAAAIEIDFSREGHDRARVIHIRRKAKDRA
jgi:hypothetical protein